MQEVVSSIVACYCAGLSSLEDASVQAQWAKDSIFDAMAAAFTGSSAVQVAELMMETGDRRMSMYIAHDAQHCLAFQQLGLTFANDRRAEWSTVVLAASSSPVAASTYMAL